MPIKCPLLCSDLDAMTAGVMSVKDPLLRSDLDAKAVDINAVSWRDQCCRDRNAIPPVIYSFLFAGTCYQKQHLMRIV